MANHCINPCDRCGADLGETGGTVCEVCRAEQDNPPTTITTIGHTATYSAEDNKLRLYVGRVPRADYDRLRAAGFTSTPKQSCDFVATWTPHREDLALEFCEDGEDIGDEDYSPQERSADRAERFSDYRDKRATEAGGSADRFDAGPAAFGHQNRARAERQARQHDRHRNYACSQWSKAEYWQQRTEAVIAHALYKSSPAVRRSRILRLEAEQRKNASDRAEYAKRFRLWSTVATLDGADRPLVKAPEGYIGINTAESSKAGRLAYALANSGHCWGEYTHPRNPDRKTSLYSLLTDETDPITPREAAALWLDGRTDPATDETSHSARWAAHYENRLSYERAMLAAEGGTAGAADMEPAGWIKASNRTGSVFTDVSGGWMQIHGVNRSPATGRVVSVKVMGTRGYRDPKPGLVSINVERLGENAYRAPTDEERAAFKAATLERKAAEKASKPKAPPLINPTDEDAQRLQDRWNAVAKAKHEAKGQTWATFTPSEVLRVTQAVYSQNSKGDYSLCETRTLHRCGKPARRSSNMYTTEGHAYDKSLGEVVAKIRVKSNGYSPDRVIVLTDKPQKPLPLDWDNLDAATVAQPETVAV